MRVYLDNAATTALDPTILEEMLPFLTSSYGNPSSIHQDGRNIRSAIEKARKQIADLLHCTPAEIFFTSGGTEADNCAIRGAVDTYQLKHAITSKVEHHAVLHTLEALEKAGKIKLSFVDLDSKGSPDLAHLEQLLQDNERSLVSLMHANNEIGNITPLHQVGEICQKYNALFHSDTVQTMCHFSHDLKTLPIDYVVGSAHKFHGPKGIGFLYIRNQSKIQPFITGGSQERKMRAGTENVYGIIGLAKAMTLAYEQMDAHRTSIETVKLYMMDRLKAILPGVSFNGLSGDIEKSLYTVLSVSLPPNEAKDMILFNLDMEGIAASGGSACTSGADIGSHVLAQLKDRPKDSVTVRFSFSKYTSKTEIDFTIQKIAKLYNIEL